MFLQMVALASLVWFPSVCFLLTKRGPGEKGPEAAVLITMAYFGFVIGGAVVNGSQPPCPTCEVLTEPERSQLLCRLQIGLPDNGQGLNCKVVNPIQK